MFPPSALAGIHLSSPQNCAPSQGLLIPESVLVTASPLKTTTPARRSSTGRDVILDIDRNYERTVVTMAPELGITEPIPR
ncbi:hypothetical protein V2G26_007762 [Clonostachys chloroleuca]